MRKRGVAGAIKCGLVLGPLSLYGIPDIIDEVRQGELMVVMAWQEVEYGGSELTKGGVQELYGVR
jgi:hypothetical protein